MIIITAYGTEDAAAGTREKASSTSFSSPSKEQIVLAVERAWPVGDAANRALQERLGPPAAGWSGLPPGRNYLYVRQQ
jgi:hypothetical protein